MDISKLVEQVKQLQENLKISQDQLAKIRVKGSAGAGAVTCEIDGNLQVIDCQIENKVLQNDSKEYIEQLVISALNDGLRSAQELVKKQMNDQNAELMKQMNIPFKFPGF